MEEVVVAQGNAKGCKDWVSVSSHCAFGTSSLVHAGNDAAGSKIYVGTLYEGVILPANVIPSKNVCSVSYGNQTHYKSDFEVLSGVGFQWIKTSDGKVPKGAVRTSGETTDGCFYVGRVNVDGSFVVGRICTKHKRIYVPIDKREFDYADYEVLCEPQKAQWYSVNEAEEPLNPILVGIREDDIPVYVGRITYMGGQTSAKVYPPPYKSAFGSKMACCATIETRSMQLDTAKVIHYMRDQFCVSLDGKEIKVNYDECEILCNGNVKWVYSCHGHVLVNAVKGGITASGDTFYIGRAFYNGSMSVGKIIPKDKVLYFPYHLKEHTRGIYEILIEN